MPVHYTKKDGSKPTMEDVLEVICVGLFFVVPVCLIVLIFILSFFGIDLMTLLT